MRRYAIPLASIVLAAGCGPQAGQVAGRVTLGGEPVAGATVTFYAADGSGHAYSGPPTDNDGAYRLRFAPSVPGLEPGRYRVTVSPYGGGDPAPGAPAPDPKARARLRLIPSAYHTARDTPLTADVVAGSNTADFDVPAK